MTWQPISTAPKDRQIFGGKWHGATWSFDLTYWDGRGWWQMRQIPPTHWQEVPAELDAPPKETAR